MSRKKARELVLCLVFEKEYHKNQNCEKLYNDLFENYGVAEMFDSFGETERQAGQNQKRRDNLTEADENYIKTTFAGVFEHIEQIDDIISGSAIGWEYSRISKISMAVLRVAVYELLYAGDIPASVAINEAVELSKRYDNPDAYTFINGVLGAVAKNNK